ncbi:family 1 glycosylhydrolase [Peredibacter starrii]|uniref:dTDP-4-dehydrorhamnose reductase n=1 Tax=Peredibacter starrii TaxID=28202 RepID=A0AAX4HS06_9BACT|nr:family 1 glycosylhydrolase [Peredibacter starrii]WPU65694.1 family 1 glycosylhydrolase [Peredibacter starrii]
MKPLEMWGGIESTLNRMGDRYINQIEKSGHHKRLNDLQLFKKLGIKKIFYPCLWETVAPRDLDHCDWSYLDERLNELKRLELKVVARLLHHGSGPVYTSLIDPDFPEKFSTYARLFATRYPEVDEYAPIHEITQTARFSCLEGLWYPHLKNETYFFKAIIHQCKATIMAMKEIRRINPRAKFIQTETLGNFFSTEKLKQVAELENNRKWFALDLLCGKVTSAHPLFQNLLQNGIREEEIKWFEENSCSPDIIGVRHTLMSDRFLDEEVSLYPEWTKIEHDKLVYTNVAAVDSGKVENVNPGSILLEAWERYQIPLAITETHILGEREAQMRWLNTTWQLADTLRKQNIQIDAVTSSALLGTFAWHDGESFYNPGAFELHAPSQKPVPTGLALLIKELATNGYSHSPVLKSEGHWETSRRIQWSDRNGDFIRFYHRSDVQPILILGANGVLAQAIASACGSRNIHNRMVRRQELDITDKDSIEGTIDVFRPWAVINAAGFIHIDNEKHTEKVTGALKLAEICGDRNIPLLTFSSDQVFEKHAKASYAESNVSAPENVFDRSEVENEDHVINAHPDALIIRTSAVLDPDSEYCVLEECNISESQLKEIANHCLDLLIDEEKGVVHLLNDGGISHQKFSDCASETMKEKLLTQTEISADHPRRIISVIKSDKQIHPTSSHQAVKKLFDLHLPDDLEQEQYQ